MKSVISLAAAFALLASEASAHYIFQQVSIAGTKHGVFEGVRQNSNYNSPVTDLASKDLVCNAGGISGASTLVLDAKVGDEIVFSTDTAVYHQGPISIYVSRAPGSVQDYDGSGGWRKLFDWGPTLGGNGQSSWPMSDNYKFTLPSCLPDGEYLLRIQSSEFTTLGPRFYVSCAQLNITGGAGSADAWEQPVEIPGVFKQTDPGYTANIYDPNMSTYTVPGGEVMGC
ncbi:unnamed protein product [Parascedosporium putredinis]|uniref:lytic cellulose monooxygenase (C4-dehydrogenating) n=1 Tax=Parascedosporium putredinis TaxID=1442378 RepID=A0A9P1H441_9PEZI|nr:unnamed protein product [Parascedosporium putredinis]CAI7995316.1 unnamed protein product [Parascedosporium putredinis]